MGTKGSWYRACDGEKMAKNWPFPSAGFTHLCLKRMRFLLADDTVDVATRFKSLKPGSELEVLLMLEQELMIEIDDGYLDLDTDGCWSTVGDAISTAWSKV